MALTELVNTVRAELRDKFDDLEIDELLNTNFQEDADEVIENNIPLMNDEKLDIVRENLSLWYSDNIDREQRSIFEIIDWELMDYLRDETMDIVDEYENSVANLDTITIEANDNEDVDNEKIKNQTSIWVDFDIINISRGGNGTAIVTIEYI